MLRRYSSRGLETIPLAHTTTTIGTKNCGICIKDSSVADIHASIEFHSFTRTFWLRDHSLAGNTTVNGVLVDGQVELRNGDLVRIGDAQPLVFENHILLPIEDDGAKNYHKHCVDKDDCGKKVILPVLGRHIVPLPSNFRPGNRRDGGSNIRATTARPRHKRSASQDQHRRASKEQDLRVQQEDSQSTPQNETGSEGSPRQIAVQYRLPKRANSVGNNLLQRVIRLQAEVARKDQELGELRSREYQLRSMSRAHAPNEAYQRGPLGSEYQNLPYDDFLPRMTLPVLSGSERSFELEAYRSFIKIIAARLQSFNNASLRYPHRDYSDVFSGFCQALEEPFAQKMNEIEEQCDDLLDKQGFDSIQRSRLKAFFLDDRKEKIAALVSELELLLPVVRDAMSTAKESIRVCSIFTQWSRQLGDQIRTNGLSTDLLLHFTNDLKDQFDNSQMSRHWLPPSLTPLLRIAALEFDKKRITNKTERETQTDLKIDDIEEIFSASERFAKIIEDLEFEKNELGVELETTKKNISSAIDSQDKDYQDSNIDLDIILKNAELKSIQLSVQLTALSRRMENIANLDISTNDRVDRLYHRIMESAESLQKSKEKLYINEDGSIIPDQVIDENTKEKTIESPIPNSEKESTFKEHPIVVDEEHTTRTMEKINEKEELQLSDEYQTESIDEARRIIKESDRVSVIKEELEEELEMENDVEPSEQEDTFSIEDELCELRDEISHYLGTDMRNGDDYDRSKKITISQDILWDVIQKVHKFIILFASTRNTRCDKWTETNMVHNSEIKDSQQTGNLISSDIFDVTPTNYMKNTEDKSRTQNTTTSNHNKMKQKVKSQTADEKDNASKLKRNNSDDITGVSYIATELDTKKAEGKKEHERNLLESHEAELFIEDGMRKYEVQPHEYNVDVLKEDRTHKNEDFTDPDKHYIIDNESASTRVDATKIQKLPVIGEQREDDEMVRVLKHQTLTQACDASENIEKSQDTGNTKLRTETIVDKQDLLDSHAITSDTLSNRIISKFDIATDLGTTILDQSKKPKSICEITHSSHIQSHINTATRIPVIPLQIPLRTYKYKSPPSKKKQKPTDDKKEDTGQDSKDKMTLKHPRFQF